MTSIPLIDLDGTLINTDMLHETAICTFGNRPSDIIKYPFWLIKGKAALKQNLASRSSIGTISYTGLVWVISPLQKAIAIDPTAAALAMLIALALTKKYSIKSN